MEKKINYQDGIGQTKTPTLAVSNYRSPRIDQPNQLFVPDNTLSEIATVITAAADVYGGIQKLKESKVGDKLNKALNDNSTAMLEAVQAIAAEPDPTKQIELASAYTSKFYDQAKNYSDDPDTQEKIKAAFRQSLTANFRNAVVKDVSERRTRDYNSYTNAANDGVANGNYTKAVSSFKSLLNDGYISQEDYDNRVEMAKKPTAKNALLNDLKAYDPVTAIEMLDKSNEWIKGIADDNGNIINVKLDRNDLSDITSKLKSDLNKDQEIRSELETRELTVFTQAIFNGEDFNKLYADPRFMHLSEDTKNKVKIQALNYKSYENMQSTYGPMLNRGELTKTNVTNAFKRGDINESDYKWLLSQLNSGTPGGYPSADYISKMNLDDLMRRVKNGEPAASVLQGADKLTESKYKDKYGLTRSQLSMSDYNSFLTFLDKSKGLAMSAADVEKRLKSVYGTNYDKNLVPAVFDDVLSMVNGIVLNGDNVSDDMIAEAVPKFYEEAKNNTIKNAINTSFGIDGTKLKKLGDVVALQGNIEILKYSDPQSYEKAKQMLAASYKKTTGKDADGIYDDQYGLTVFEDGKNKYVMSVESGVLQPVEYTKYLAQHPNLTEYRIGVGEMTNKGQNNDRYIMLRSGWWVPKYVDNGVENMQTLDDGYINNAHYQIWHPMYKDSYGDYVPNKDETYIIYQTASGPKIEEYNFEVSESKEVNAHNAFIQFTRAYPEISPNKEPNKVPDNKDETQPKESGAAGYYGGFNIEDAKNPTKTPQAESVYGGYLRPNITPEEAQTQKEDYLRKYGR